MIIKHFARPFTVHLGLLLLGIGGIFPLPAMAQAQPRPDARPDKTNEQRRPPATKGRSAGSRGCSFDWVSPASAPFRLMLAPSGQAALIEAQPTCGWTIGTPQPVAVIFRLYAVADDQSLPQILVEEQLQDIPAGAEWLSYTVQEPLANGRYLWQVELVCDRDRPSGNLALEGQFQKISVSSELSAALAQAPEADKAPLLQSAGYWYDARSYTLKTLPSLQNGFRYGNP